MRHALAEILLRHDLGDVGLRGASITVTEVRMSADLRRATACVLPLGGAGAPEVLAALEREATELRMRLGRLVPLRYSPTLEFALDQRFDQAERIETLLRGGRAPRSDDG